MVAPANAVKPLAQSLVIDNTKYFRNVLDLNLDKGYVEVEPGIALDHLNSLLKQHGLWYPVDVSTAAQATIGGMAGNNSCGSRSIAYGNMAHNILGIDAWLANGQVAQFGNYANSTAVAQQLSDPVKNLATTLAPEIEKCFPKVLRRVAGYNLDIFNPQSELPYTQDGSMNLAHLLVGSEGILAYYKSLKLAPLPQHKVLGIVNFASFYKAMDSAQHSVKLGHTAVELVYRTMIDLARSNPSFKTTIETTLIDHTAQTPAAILLVEFSGEAHALLLEKLKALQELMSDLGLPDSVVSMPDASLQKHLWEVRKAGLNIMMSLKGDGKPVSFIEDCAVPLESLADYTKALTEVFAQYGSRGTWYAHASVGILHIRHILDMQKKHQRWFVNTKVLIVVSMVMVYAVAIGSPGSLALRSPKPFQKSNTHSTPMDYLIQARSSIHQKWMTPSTLDFRQVIKLFHCSQHSTGLPGTYKTIPLQKKLPHQALAAIQLWV